jgi:hypothetical protein
MTATAWGALSIVVSAVVALIVAAQHRRQARQIEMHREDPSVPLKPPPHPVTRALKASASYLALIPGACMLLAHLVSAMGREGPVTRVEVFDISFTLVLLAGLVTFAAFMAVGEMIFRRINGTKELARRGSNRRRP